MEDANGALVFSSRLMGRDAAVEGFRELYAAGTQVECTAAEVFASVRSRLLPEMVVFERRLDGLRLTRDAARVRRTGFDHFVVQHVVSGELRLDFGDDRRTLRAGDVAFVDTTRPFTTEAVGCRFHTLSLPRARLAEAGLDVSRLHGAAAAASAVEAQAAFAALMEGGGRGDPRTVLDRLLRPPTARPGEGAARLQRRERALAFIEAHLARSDLTPETVAAGSHTSRATLYRAFEELGGVSEWILSRRLRRLRTALETDRRPLAELIGRFGFVSLSHATSAFQARYGVPPGALRAERRAEAPVASDPGELTRRLLDDMPASLARTAPAAIRSAA